MQSVGSSEPVHFPVSQLTIITEKGRQDFTIEVASSEEQQQYGLMNRKFMPRNHGMLFDFGVARPVSMWMKDTFIPLDMLFVNNSGIITRIEKNAEPESTTIIPSGGDARAVIELNGGASDAYAIQPGDRVIYAIFP